MPRFNRLRLTGLRLALAGLVLAGLSACTSYRIHSIQHHGALPVMKLELVATDFSLFWSSDEHQFWLCEDKGTELVCRRSCGGGTDLECPTTVYGDQMFVTNTR